MARREELDLPPVRLYRQLDYGEQLVVFADPADSKDFCAAVAFSKKHYDYPLVFNAVMESSQFGYELYNFCKYIHNHTGMWPKLAVERNVGQATIFVLRNLNYPDLFRMVDFSSINSQEHGQIGWLTTGNNKNGELVGTRRKMLDDFAMVLRQNQVRMYDEQQIKQFKSFVIYKGRAQARGVAHDDLVMATTGAWQIHLITPDAYLMILILRSLEKNKTNGGFDNGREVDVAWHDYIYDWRAPAPNSRYLGSKSWRCLYDLGIFSTR